MLHSRIKLAGIILILFIAGCREKDELTRPVKVQFDIKLSLSFKIGVSLDSSLNAEYLHFTGCRIGLGNIEFTGKREEGGNYYFQTDPRLDFPKPTNSWLLQSTTFSIFDMPQGIYTNMTWVLQLWAIANEDLIDLDEGLTVEDLIAAGVVEDCGDGWWNGPAMAISGTYKSNDGTIIPFLIAGDFILPYGAINQKLMVGSFNPEGNTRIVMSADKKYESTMIFTLGCDSCSLDRELFEDAEISGNNEHPIIIISDSNNKELYENLTTENNLSIKVIIKETGPASI
jgi:hypothetical protein